MRISSFCCYMVILCFTMINFLVWSMPLGKFSCQDQLVDDDPVSCQKQKLEELKETLRNSSRMHVEERGSMSQQIDQIAASLEELEQEQKGDCASVTWTNVIMHTLFGKNHLCV